MAKLNEEAVKVILWHLMHNRSKYTASRLARLHGVSSYTIWDIWRGRNWSWVELKKRNTKW